MLLSIMNDKTERVAVAMAQVLAERKTSCLASLIIRLMGKQAIR